MNRRMNPTRNSMRIQSKRPNSIFQCNVIFDALASDSIQNWLSLIFESVNRMIEEKVSNIQVSTNNRNLLVAHWTREPKAINLNSLPSPSDHSIWVLKLFVRQPSSTFFLFSKTHNAEKETNKKKKDCYIFFLLYKNSFGLEKIIKSKNPRRKRLNCFH